MLHQLPEIQPSAFPKESTGRRMTNKIPVICYEETIADVERLLIKKTNLYDTINYIYVIDNVGKLVNVISIKEVFRLPKTKKVSEFPQKELVKVRAHTDQEHVASRALEHSLKAVPVVDKEDRLIGIVPSDEILRILDNENIEDFLRFAGVHRFDKAPYEMLKASTGNKLRLAYLGL